MRRKGTQFANWRTKLVGDGKRELAGLMIEEPVGDLDVQEKIRGEQDPERQTERDRPQQKAARHGEPKPCVSRR